MNLNGLSAHMRLRIPVYIINASYMLPLTLLIYFKYGRPPKPDPAGEQQQAPHCHSSGQMPKENTGLPPPFGNGQPGACGHGSDGTLKKRTADMTVQPTSSVDVRWIRRERQNDRILSS